VITDITGSIGATMQASTVDAYLGKSVVMRQSVNDLILEASSIRVTDLSVLLSSVRVEFHVVVR